MVLLISKCQYKISEKGEFHEIAERSLGKTISLFLNFPWNTERSLASIELTCPSITIEHPIGTYLKIGPYFSGKFSIYYLNTNKKVYVKIANTLEDACAWIKIYFEQSGNIKGFDKYSYTINPSAHFRTNSFEYMVDKKATVRFFNFSITISVYIFFLCCLKYFENPEYFKSSFVLMMLLFLLILSSPLIYFFFNYLSADKDNYLQISRGHDEFSFGAKENFKSYSKKDIAEIDGYGPRYTRSFLNQCEVFIFTFKNGEQIKFTSLLISSNMLRQKFPEHKFKNNEKRLPTFDSVCVINV